MNIKVLDCTLRDGGYINDWNFGNGTIINIFRSLVKANIEFVEIGFLNDKVIKSLDRSIMHDTKIINDIFINENKNKSIILAMIDYGTCDIDNIEDCSNTFIDGIRVIFKKNNIENALNFCSQLMKKGYKVFIQPVSITSYTFNEFKNLINKVNKINPFAMSIVDTYGLMYKEDLFKYFKIIENNLNKSIYVGYHSHNNLQLSFSNCMELLHKCTPTTNVILDSTLYGMGKFAGNANTELLCSYLNSNYSKDYDVNEILDIIDKEIIGIYNEKNWGYTIYNYLSAINSCHPKYVGFLFNKNILSLKDINKILKKLKGNLIFDEKKIESIYKEYINR